MSESDDREPGMGGEPKILVLVDGYSSAAQLPSVLRERGWRCVHVKSLPHPPPYLLTTFHSEDYIAHLTYEGDLPSLVREVERYRPAAVLPGAESGVVVADLLAAALGLPGNQPATSVARRDKYEMHNRLRGAGLRAMDHYLAHDSEGLRAWADKGPWPVVCKPLASAGTDSVIFCTDSTELEVAFKRVFHSINVMGERNDAVLAQRFLEGQEYFVNGISGYGQHLITEIWQADKIRVQGAGTIYDRSILHDPTSPEMATLVTYLHEVFDALGIRYGPHHTELIVTEAGPTLVECGSRLSGGLNRPAANYAVGVSMLDLVAGLLVDGEPYLTHLTDSGIGHRHPLWQVQFISHLSGEVAQTHYEELTATLQSRTWLQRAPRLGDRVSRTIDLVSSPGIIFLSHEDTDVLNSDYEIIRSWERDNRLFAVR